MWFHSTNRSTKANDCESLVVKNVTMCDGSSSGVMTFFVLVVVVNRAVAQNHNRFTHKSQQFHVRPEGIREKLFTTCCMTSSSWSRVEPYAHRKLKLGTRAGAMAHNTTYHGNRGVRGGMCPATDNQSHHHRTPLRR